MYGLDTIKAMNQPGATQPKRAFSCSGCERQRDMEQFIREVYAKLKSGAIANHSVREDRERLKLENRAAALLLPPDDAAKAVAALESDPVAAQLRAGGWTDKQIARAIEGLKG